MTAKTTTKKADVPVRVPPKLGTQGPQSGPSGETVIDLAAPVADADRAPSDPKAAKAQAKRQAAAENDATDRAVKVRATRVGYINRLIAEDTVFVLSLAKGEQLPSWVEAVPDDVPTTASAHSAEAQPEVVDADGRGTPLTSADVL